MLTEIVGGYVSATSRSSDSTLDFILIISILLAELMVVVIVLLYKIKKWSDEHGDYYVGYIDNDASQNAVDARLLDKDTIIEAIRSNGYTSNIYDDSVEFSCRGDNYIIPDVGQLPVFAMAKIFGIASNVYDIDLMHEAARQVSDEMVIAKVLFSDDDSKIHFTISAIENKYGHFRDCLPKYVEIIDEAHFRFMRIYKDLGSKGKEELTMEPRISSSH